MNEKYQVSSPNLSSLFSLKICWQRSSRSVLFFLRSPALFFVYSLYSLLRINHYISIHSFTYLLLQGRRFLCWRTRQVLFSRLRWSKRVCFKAFTTINVRVSWIRIFLFESSIVIAFYKLDDTVIIFKL